MATLFRSGPGHLFIGADPTTLTHCGPTESITFDANVQSTGVQTAFTGDAYDADGIFALPPSPTCSVELYDNTVETLLQFFIGSSVMTGIGDQKALGLGGKIQKITPPVVAIIPQSEIDLGIDAPSGVWLPGAMVSNVSGMQHGRLTANSNAAAPFTVQFSAAKRREIGGEAIPENFQFGWIGAVGALGLTATWALGPVTE
jgi:hypothetical protein